MSKMFKFIVLFVVFFSSCSIYQEPNINNVRKNNLIDNLFLQIEMESNNYEYINKEADDVIISERVLVSLHSLIDLTVEEVNGLPNKDKYYHKLKKLYTEATHKGFRDIESWNLTGENIEKLKLQ